MRTEKIKKTGITQKYLKSILDYNQKTGIFIWKNNRGRIQKGDIAGHINKKGYMIIMIDYVNFQLHRMAWLYVTGELPKCQIDHINRIKNDNRICNLREANPSQNQWNRKSSRTSVSGFKGVYPLKYGGFRARIKLFGKHIHLGIFKTAKEAHEVYCKKGVELRGEFFNSE